MGKDASRALPLHHGPGGRSRGTGRSDGHHSDSAADCHRPPDRGRGRGRLDLLRAAAAAVRAPPQAVRAWRGPTGWLRCIAPGLSCVLSPAFASVRLTHGAAGVSQFLRHLQRRSCPCGARDLYRQTGYVRPPWEKVLLRAGRVGRCWRRSPSAAGRCWPPAVLINAVLLAGAASMCMSRSCSSAAWSAPG